MQESFWWWQCSDRYIVYHSPHLHTPLPPFSPSLISLTVSVHVKHHVYLLTSTRRCFCGVCLLLCCVGVFVLALCRCFCPCIVSVFLSLRCVSVSVTVFYFTIICYCVLFYFCPCVVSVFLSLCCVGVSVLVLCRCFCPSAVSYTHLTLPTRLIV